MALHDRGELEVLWDRYVSACDMGGTPAERRFAFERWMKADDEAARVRHLSTKIGTVRKVHEDGKITVELG